MKRSWRGECREMRFALLKEHGVKSAAAAGGSWSLAHFLSAVSGFLGKEHAPLFLFSSLESTWCVTCFFLFIIIILNIHYLETAGAWKPILVLISKSLQHSGGSVRAIT